MLYQLFFSFSSNTVQHVVGESWILQPFLLLKRWVTLINLCHHLGFNSFNSKTRGWFKLSQKTFAALTPKKSLKSVPLDTKSCSLANLHGLEHSYLHTV